MPIPMDSEIQQNEEGYSMYKPSRVTVLDGYSSTNMEIERAQDIRKSLVVQQKEILRHPPVIVENTSDLFSKSTKRELSEASQASN